MAETTGEKIVRELLSRGFEPDGKTSSGQAKYRGNSPLRSSSDSQAFVVMIGHDGEHGGYHDHAFPDHQGSLYDLARKLDIPLPELEPTEVQTTKREYRNLADYAAAHGISADVLKAAGWYETMKESKLKGGTIYTERRALAFPTRGGMRWRFLDGKKPHFISDKGYKRCWYGLNGGCIERLIAGQPLILCNGEISVVTAHEYGLAAVCITAGENIGKNGYPPELIQQLRHELGPNINPEILVAMDCDPAGRQTARTASQQFADAGYKVRAIDLRLGLKGDLANFCMLHENQALVELLMLPELEATESFIQATDVQGEELSFRFIPEALLHTLPPITWLIPGLIVDHGTNMMYGSSGVYKSFYAIDLALTIGQTRPVIYVAGEGEGGMLIRFDAWYDHHNLPRRSGNTILCYGSPSFLDAEEMEAFMSMASIVQPSAIFVDTVAMSMTGGDENSTRDMGLYVKACKGMTREFGCATVLIHHSQKNGDLERGNTSLRNSCDQVLHITRDDALVCIEVSKAKDGKVPPVKYVEFLPVALEYHSDGSGVLIPVDKIVHDKSDAITNQEQKILNVLAMPTFLTEGAELSEIMDVACVTKGSALRSLDRLLQKGLIGQPNGPRSPRVITPQGLVALDKVKQSAGDS